MELSVVVPTLNGRDRLITCLDALADHVPSAEVLVVNGPSADGTTGMVRDREDVSVLIELSDRNVNAARNAGISAASGDVVAFVDERSVVEADWLDAVTAGIDDGADVVTGPIHQALRVGATTSAPEQRRIGANQVMYFDGGNVVFTRETLDALDGFDEYLQIGGSRDAAHRLAALDRRIEWAADAIVRRERRREPPAEEREWGWKYRSLTYRLAKNYGPRPSIILRTIRHALDDGFDALKQVFAGELRASAWVGDGRDVTANSLRGLLDGLIARLRDRRPARNPNGVSSRQDRIVQRYDWH